MIVLSRFVLQLPKRHTNVFDVSTSTTDIWKDIYSILSDLCSLRFQIIFASLSFLLRSQFIFFFTSFTKKKTHMSMAPKAPKKPWTVLTNPGTDDIPLPPLEISWPQHPVARDHFWENVRKMPVEVEALAEDGSSAGGGGGFSLIRLCFGTTRKAT